MFQSAWWMLCMLYSQVQSSLISMLPKHLRKRTLLLPVNYARSPGCSWGGNCPSQSACLTPSGLSPTSSYHPSSWQEPMETPLTDWWRALSPLAPTIHWSVASGFPSNQGSKASLKICTVLNLGSGWSSSVILFPHIDWDEWLTYCNCPQTTESLLLSVSRQHSRFHSCWA